MVALDVTEAARRLTEALKRRSFGVLHVHDLTNLNMALPCRVSVYQKGENTQIGMLSPKAMLAELSDSKALRDVAAEVESVLVASIEEVAKVSGELK
jgi:uncharacterized protein (DUF302 family)